ncbi:MAG TPA: delta-class carbonic anhydrase [Thermoanaerobaculia bacterium]|nr:delta-class carbonic anhydrase [Thermoanaerobaculia bacterium]
MAKHRFAVFSILSAALCAGTGGTLLADECYDRNVPAPCETVGPQTPRDILNRLGENPVRFSKAPPMRELRLCDIHFHRSAENKIPGSVPAIPPGEGFVCTQMKGATAHDAEGEGADRKVCQNVGLFDTVEVHWVYTTCNVEPAPCLTSCFSPSCLNPELRVAAQVFFLTPNGYPRATDWQESGYDHYPPPPNGNVEFLGSTTGDKFNRPGPNNCSPYQATWSVARSCRPLTLASLGRWCDTNVYNERKPHGVRKLVTDPKLLARIP